MSTKFETIPPTEAVKATFASNQLTVLENDYPDLYKEGNQVAVSAVDPDDVTYEQITQWFCEGYSFENVLFALEASTKVAYSTDELLEMTKSSHRDEICRIIGY